MKAYHLTLYSMFVLGGCDIGPETRPNIDDLTGIYRLVSAPSICGLETESVSKSTISLDRDLSVSVSNIPDCIFHLNNKGKYLSGEGKWKVVIPELDSSYGIFLDIGEGNTLSAGIYNSLILVGKSKPFTLAYVIGDPDSMNRLIYEKEY